MDICGRLWGGVSAIVFVIVAILLLPVYISVKFGEGGEFVFCCKVLNITLAQTPSKGGVIEKRIRKKAQSSPKNEDKLEEKKLGSIENIRKNLNLIKDVLSELIKLIGHCTAKVFKLEIIISSSDAAKTAIAYGECCAIAAPVLGYLHSVMNIKRSGEAVNISCDYSGERGAFFFETVLVVRIFRILSALFRILLSYLRRQKNLQSEKSPRAAVGLRDKSP